ncbi:response regulator [Dictyobacter vulcani]|uniref:response regulator n=1 Tax=Dictyobacter vulcani TaxID=2607529 RepID=UPI00124F8EB7|nr:response regulator [Dictyobacter vulcani]
MDPPQQRNILIIDDNLEDRVAIRRYLLKDWRIRFTIHEASNGRQGLSQCQSLQLDCVLLDYNLPDMTGTAFLDHLRIKPDQPFLPVVVLTGVAAKRSRCSR